MGRRANINQRGVKSKCVVLRGGGEVKSGARLFCCGGIMLAPIINLIKAWRIMKAKKLSIIEPMARNLLGKTSPIACALHIRRPMHCREYSREKCGSSIGNVNVSAWYLLPRA